MAARGLGRLRRAMMAIKMTKCIASIIWIHVCCHSTYFFLQVVRIGARVSRGVRADSFEFLFSNLFFLFSHQA
jgi:hypothetical protein